MQAVTLLLVRCVAASIAPYGKRLTDKLFLALLAALFRFFLFHAHNAWIGNEHVLRTFLIQWNDRCDDSRWNLGGGAAVGFGIADANERGAVDAVDAPFGIPKPAGIAARDFFQPDQHLALR